MGVGEGTDNNKTFVLPPGSSQECGCGLPKIRVGEKAVQTGSIFFKPGIPEGLCVNPGFYQWCCVSR